MPVSLQSRPRLGAAWPRRSSGACAPKTATSISWGRLGREIESPGELALSPLEMPYSVSETATATVLGATRTLVAVAAPDGDAALAVLVGGSLVATGAGWPPPKVHRLTRGLSRAFSFDGRPCASPAANCHFT